MCSPQRAHECWNRTTCCLRSSDQSITFGTVELRELRTNELAQRRFANAEIADASSCFPEIVDGRGIPHRLTHQITTSLRLACFADRRLRARKCLQLSVGSGDTAACHDAIVGLSGATESADAEEPALRTGAARALWGRRAALRRHPGQAARRVRQGGRRQG